MRTARLLTALFLAALTATSAAANPPSEPAPSLLYVLERAALPQGSGPLLPDAAEEFLIEVDPEEVAANPWSFLIDLPDQPLLEAVRTRFVDNRPDWKSWFGTLRYADGGDPAGSIQVGYHGARITALIELDKGDRYQIAGGAEERYRLVRLDMAKAPRSCGLETANATEEPFHDEQPRMSSAPLFETCTTNARIDLLVVYPSKGMTKLGYFDLPPSYESNLSGFVHQSIDRANEVFRNNGLNAYYHLVSDPVPLISTSMAPRLSSALFWMNEEHAELTNLREAFGADIVAVYIPLDWKPDDPNDSDNACGLGNLRRKDGQISTPFGGVGPFSDRAFSAHRGDCGLADYTLAHEIGHNYGMRHHIDTDFANFVFPWARGYAFPDPVDPNVTRLTVMGNCSLGQPCNRIPAFSDPARKYDPTITPPMNPINTNTGVCIGDDAHNNALVACQQIGAYTDQPGSYSGLKTQSSNPQPTANFTVSCSGLTCTFNASNSTDDAAIVSYYWDFGDGKTDKGMIASRTYLSAGSYRVHLVVTDSGGKTNVKWSMANPWNPVYEGYVEHINCRQISGWAWDQAIPNTPINVDIYRDSTKVATIPANAFRQNLLNAGKGNGYHGFGYTPTSSWKDGRWHTASVRFGGTSTHLIYLVPRDIICKASMFTDLTPVDTLPTGGKSTVGTQFSSSRSGQITQLGFYRASGETDSTTLSLWNDSAGKLASKPASCTSSGWCWAVLDSPVTITAGTRYRVGVTVNTSYVKTGCGIPGGYTKDPLTAHQGVWSTGGGVFPTTGTCSNFFVDVRFDI